MRRYCNLLPHSSTRTNVSFLFLLILLPCTIFSSSHRKSVRIKENTPIGTSVITDLGGSKSEYPQTNNNDDGFDNNNQNTVDTAKFTVVSQIVRREGRAGKRVKYFTAQNNGIVYVSQNIDREKICGSRVQECAIDVEVSQ